MKKLLIVLLFLTSISIFAQKNDILDEGIKSLEELGFQPENTVIVETIRTKIGTKLLRADDTLLGRNYEDSFYGELHFNQGQLKFKCDVFADRCQNKLLRTFNVGNCILKQSNDKILNKN
ncbi:MAG: hypothetical protein KAQ98_13815 [Bacteriovoracaceae bacterium]|nr:hypothetical protein [Bacteriovoracaceae bacterium]